ncbi:hypothetical protein J6590_063332 [Homalodisca vitripennis]|nr:hypothetical protein J6590_063332 [Homalodisca vitripennis]
MDREIWTQCVGEAKDHLGYQEHGSKLQSGSVKAGDYVAGGIHYSPLLNNSLIGTSLFHLIHASSWTLHWRVL